MIFGWMLLDTNSFAFSNSDPARTSADVLPSPIELSTDVAKSTKIFTIGWPISNPFSISVPDFVIRVLPSESSISLLDPFGPKLDLTLSETCNIACRLFPLLLSGSNCPFFEYWKRDFSRDRLY
jgi:hypothetical protein